VRRGFGLSERAIAVLKGQLAPSRPFIMGMPVASGWLPVARLADVTNQWSGWLLMDIFGWHCHCAQQLDCTNKSSKTSQCTACDLEIEKTERMENDASCSLRQGTKIWMRNCNKIANALTVLDTCCHQIHTFSSDMWCFLWTRGPVEDIWWTSLKGPRSIDGSNSQTVALVSSKTVQLCNTRIKFIVNKNDHFVAEEPRLLQTHNWHLVLAMRHRLCSCDRQWFDINPDSKPHKKCRLIANACQNMIAAMLFQLTMAKQVLLEKKLAEQQIQWQNLNCWLLQPTIAICCWQCDAEDTAMTGNDLALTPTPNSVKSVDSQPVHVRTWLQQWCFSWQRQNSCNFFEVVILHLMNTSFVPFLHALLFVLFCNCMCFNCCPVHDAMLRNLNSMMTIIFSWLPQTVVVMFKKWPFFTLGLSCVTCQTCLHFHSHDVLPQQTVKRLQWKRPVLSNTCKH